MKKLFALVLVMLLVFSATAMAEEKIHMVAPMSGYSQDQIDAAYAKDTGLTGTDNFRIGVTLGMLEDYPEYDVEWVDWGWSETLDSKQRSLFAAGEIPDVVSGETFIPTYAYEGLLAPLPQDIIDMVYPSFLWYDENGDAVAVAYRTSIFLLWYNKDLMAAAGLDPETPPTTWEEWKQMSDAITAAGNGEFYGGGIPTFPHAGGALRATPFFRQNGTDFAIDGQENLSDPALQETLQFIRDMNANFPEGLGNGADESPLWDAFNKGTIAFAVDGGWRQAECINNNLNWGVCPLPTRDGTVGNCLVGTVYLAVPKDGAHVEQAFDIIREVLKAENDIHWLEEGSCPGNREVIDNEELYADSVGLTLMMDGLKNGTYSGVAVFSKNDSAIWEIINRQVLQRLTMTDDPIETICADAQAQIQMLQQ